MAVLGRAPAVAGSMPRVAVRARLAAVASPMELHIGARDRGTHAHTAHDDQDREREPRSIERAHRCSFPVHVPLPLSAPIQY